MSTSDHRDRVSARNQASHAKNRERNNARHRRLRQLRKQGADSQVWAVKKLLSDAARRAAAKGLPFDLTLAALGDFPTHCPVFGVELVYQAEGKRINASASLDRIDSQRGYIQGNVWLISWRANQIKNDATAAELRAVADALDGVLHRDRPKVAA